MSHFQNVQFYSSSRKAEILTTPKESGIFDKHTLGIGVFAYLRGLKFSPDVEIG